MRAIQEVAVRRFALNGFEAVTIDEIAEEAAVSPSTVYRYFGVKEQLVVWDEHDAAIESALGQHFGELPPFDALATAFATAYDLSHEQQYDIITTARQLQKRQLDVMALPTIHVWKDSENKIWTINHRRLATFILAGNMKVVPVVWADQKEVENNRFEYTTRTGGKSILALLTNRLALKIEAQ